MFEITDGYNLELQMPETMELFGSLKNWLTNKNGGNVPSFKGAELPLAQCNLVDKQHHQKSEVFSTLCQIN